MTDGFRNVRIETTVDPFLAAGCFGTFFAARRWALAPDATRWHTLDNPHHPILFSMHHSDLEHSSARACGSVVLILPWILALPAAFRGASRPSAPWLTAAWAFATSVAIASCALDTLQLPERALLRDLEQKTRSAWAAVAAPCGARANRWLGCVMTGHAWWHVASFAAGVALAAARDATLWHATRGV